MTVGKRASGQHGHRAKGERDDDIRRVAVLWASGLNTTRIAELMGYDWNTAARDIDAAKEIWRKEATAKVDEHMADMLGQLGAALAKAWEGWYGSTEAREETTSERQEVQVQGTLGGKVPAERVKASVKMIQQRGDPHWLDTIGRLVELKMKLLGLGKENVDVGGTLTWVDLARAERAKQ